MTILENLIWLYLLGFCIFGLLSAYIRARTGRDIHPLFVALTWPYFVFWVIRESFKNKY